MENFIFCAVRLAQNCTFPQNFNTRKLGKITVFYTVIITGYMLIAKLFIKNETSELYIFYIYQERFWKIFKERIFQGKKLTLTRLQALIFLF